MKPIILITSCDKYRLNSYNTAARLTWLKDSPIDYRFILGRGCSDLLPDETRLDVNDSRTAVPEKCHAGWVWARACGYTHVFQCASDTYISIKRLQASGWEKHDCVGCLIGDAPVFPGGGCGYGLGPLALDALCAARPSDFDHKYGDDLLTGTVLARVGITMTHDARYWTGDGKQVLFPFWEKDVWDSGVISAHLGQCQTYEPQWVYACHQSFLENAK